MSRRPVVALASILASRPFRLGGGRTITGKLIRVGESVRIVEKTL